MIHTELLKLGKTYRAYLSEEEVDNSKICMFMSAAGKGSKEQDNDTQQRTKRHYCPYRWGGSEARPLRVTTAG